MNMIEELDMEGINFQETRLNLIHQGYEWYLDSWIRMIIFEAEWKRHFEITKEFLKERGLI